MKRKKILRRAAALCAAVLLAAICTAGCGEGGETDTVEEYHLDDLMDSVKWLGLTPQEAGIGARYVYDDRWIFTEGSLFDEDAYGQAVLSGEEGSPAVTAVYLVTDAFDYSECRDKLIARYGLPADSGESPSAESDSGTEIWCLFRTEKEEIRLSHGSNRNYVEIEVKARAPESGHIDGSVISTPNDNAPKTIESTEITFFYCEVSLQTLDLPEDCPLTQQVYAFTAQWDGGDVVCTCRTSEQGENIFTEDPSFLTTLNSLVTAYNLAQYNGINLEAQGLSDHCGIYLDIRYASGESIYARNNETMFLPLDAVEHMAELFRYVPVS
ncbi:MAG: hypothetical protein IKD96_02765 [Oscillospiraceae bacterium]|nr:hypothetical protein [Oscillospiraceae bacterium]